MTPRPQTLLSLTDMVVAGPTQVNPYMADAERIVEDYCERLNIKMNRFRDYTTMTAYLFPRAEPARLVALNLMLNLQWYVDDIYDRDTAETIADKEERGRFYTECLNILNTGQLPADDDHVFYPVFKVLHEMIAPLAPGDWLTRFTDSLRPHFQVTTDPLDVMDKNPLQAIDNYIQMREIDSGMRPTIDMVEFAYNIYLPDTVMQHPYMQQMTAYTALIGSLTNDLFSYEKEVLRLNSEFNILYILMQTAGMTFEQAVDDTMRRLNGYITSFIAAEAATPDFGNEAVNKGATLYIQGLKDEIIATWHWQISTNRYRSSNSPFAELREILPD